MISKLVVALVSTANVASAWWGTGHLLTARVAYDTLLNDNREDIIDQVEETLAKLNMFVNSEGKHPFVEAATFADFIKNSGWNSLTTWHYTDQPFFDEGYYTEVHLDSENVTWAIAQMHEQIVDPIGTIYGPSNNIQPVDVDLSRSFNLRLLIHYLGDVHQPLHAVSRYTENYPDGDAGGNLFPIPASGKDDGVTNLHAVWDAVAYKFDDFLQQPLSDEDWTYLGTSAFNIRMNNPVESFTDLDKESSEWAAESLQLAKSDVYPEAHENQPLTDDYITCAVATCERQIAKGGYRLARLLTQIMEEINADQQFD